MKTTWKTVELYSSPKEAWANLEGHQAMKPKGTFWVRQVEVDAGPDWAIVQEVQEEWEELAL